MLGKIFGILCLLSLAFAIPTGRIAEVANAIPDGAEGAVKVLLSLGGMMCLWGGLMEVLREVGIISRLSRLLSPVLRLFFPEAYRTGEGAEEISANVSANLLGIGNAATPLALAAMKELQKHNPDPTRASDEEITLAVLNTASVTLVPANLLALRRAAGSSNPFSVILPAWVVSLLCATMALFLTSIPRLARKKRQKRTTCMKKTYD